MGGHKAKRSCLQLDQFRGRWNCFNLVSLVPQISWKEKLQLETCSFERGNSNYLRLEKKARMPKK